MSQPAPGTQLQVREPELTILPRRIAGSGYEIATRPQLKQRLSQAYDCKRYRNRIKYFIFQPQRYSNDTQLSKYIWKLKELQINKISI